MSDAVRTTATKGAPVTSPRKIAVAAGVLYLVTHVTSVVGLLLYDPILNDAGYIIGAGHDTQVLVAASLEAILVLAIVGTGVALYPVVKRQNEGVALGYVGLRTLEAGIIAVGVVPVLTIVTLRQQLAGTAGADTATLVTLGNALVAFHNWTFLLGPSYVCGTNTVLLAYLLYRSGLVPRFIPVLGLVGGPLVFASGAAQMFGIYEQISLWAAIAAVPVFAWELALAIWLVARGFNAAAVTVASPNTATHELPSAA
jgi:hypothetical protein